MAADTRTVTKKDLIEKIAARTSLGKAGSRDALQAVLETIIDELSDGKRIELREFGVFEVKVRAARTAQNPRTLERVRVPPRGVVRFKPGRKLKEATEESEAVLSRLEVNVVSRDVSRVDHRGG